MVSTDGGSLFGISVIKKMENPGLSNTCHDADDSMLH